MTENKYTHPGVAAGVGVTTDPRLSARRDAVADALHKAAYGGDMGAVAATVADPHDVPADARAEFVAVTLVALWDEANSRAARDDARRFHILAVNLMNEGVFTEFYYNDALSGLAIDYGHRFGYLSGLWCDFAHWHIEGARPEWAGALNGITRMDNGDATLPLNYPAPTRPAPTRPAP